MVVQLVVILVYWGKEVNSGPSTLPSCLESRGCFLFWSFLKLIFARCIFLHPLTFNLLVFLSLIWALCRLHIVSTLTISFNWSIRSQKSNVIFDMFSFKTPPWVLFILWIFFLFPLLLLHQCYFLITFYFYYLLISICCFVLVLSVGFTVYTFSLSLSLSLALYHFPSSIKNLLFLFSLPSC